MSKGDHRPPKTEPSSLLHFYRLQSGQTQRVVARSDAHERAYVRLRLDDVEMLSGRTTATQEPIVALFCTHSSNEPVSLRAGEQIEVCLTPAIAGKTPADASWLSLRVLVHHAYVGGMRVSGTIHRAVVRLALN
jgi:hypothetical protein